MRDQPWAAPAAALDDVTYDDLVHDGEQLDREERAALRRVAGLSTELEDVTEVEYRQLRLERVVLAGVWTGGTADEADNSLRELAALAETAGSTVLAGLLQRRDQPDPATYLGKGKAAELRDVVVAEGADTVVCDGELSPGQRRALEDVVKVKVIDRTALILDIFAQHAKSREGKAQVELAQLQYLLPRLRGWGESMSRQAGGRVAGGEGIGSRGPGETKIELDRRRINSRIAKLKRDIATMKTGRDTKRASRKAHGVPSVVIAGYTNAGKSSLLNRLTGAGVLVENQLFATLDPTVRRAHTQDGRVYTLADTVGFVRSLPHQLVEAFRSTLEEVADADLVLHVVDGSHPDPEGQISAVREVLADVGAATVRELIVVNKADAADPEVIARLARHEKHLLVVSCRTGDGMATLVEQIAEELPRPDVSVEVLLPYHRGDLLHRIHADGDVLTSEHIETGTAVTARVRPDLAAELAPYASAREGSVMPEIAMSRPFVPDGFVVPDPPVTDDFTFEVLGPQHNAADLAAWTGSMAHIHATPGFGRSWPVRAFTAAENLRDLQMHADDFVARTGFTWTVLDPATRQTIGCLYVYPPKDGEPGVDADVRSWVVENRAELDAVLYRHILGWLRAEWPFTSIRYAVR